MPTLMTRYRDVRHKIRSGDLGLVRNSGSLIARTGRSQYSHAFTCVWRVADQDTLSVAESREWRGGQVLSLSSQVRRFPGRIDILRPNDLCPDSLRERAATVAYNWAGHAYSYPNIAKIALVHHPLLREAIELAGYAFDLTDTRPTPWELGKICSQMHAWAYRWAKDELLQEFEPAQRRMLRKEGVYGWDPCPELGDSWIEPGDLARSGSYDKVFEGLVI